MHPVIMLCLTGLVFYVLRLGATRFASKRLGRQGVFAWKRHVSLGRVTLAGLLLGVAGGLGVTWGVWSGPGATGWHALLGACAAVLAVSGAVTGGRLDRGRGKAPAGVALLHAAGNTLLAALCLAQVWTGWRVLENFVW
ncbi:DUF4079 family protein [Fundidesulfovibrio magnetotacticus]|uniref:DUF4079 family protein n=1 Tax=Fundidesulfovibrio magnetotacticus TaxID=2730080 RepID=UPI001562FB94|nr:DUF4079 family protein [Fundidesulfovibrio magnetotacticus]